MRILVYGGTFNPPHRGHVHAVEAARRALEAERVFLVPASIPPHKPLAEGSPDAAERLRMTELAAAEIPGAEVLALELRREGVSYTSDTLRELKASFPEDELTFLVGTDMLLSLPAWHEPETICRLASIAVLARENGRESDLEAAAERLRGDFGATVHVIPGEPVEVSSSELRELLPKREGRELLPEKVYAYIIRRRLYGANPELAWLRERAYAYLKPKRVPHVVGVEQEAVRLAKRWDVSEDAAAEAAICHDITKKLEREEQLRLCGKYAIMTDEFERAGEKLLHAKTGAALAADLFGLSDEVSLAIRFHTTGRPGMSRLEMITYLADYIEPGRSGFDGLQELRRAAYEDLDLAMELGMRMSLEEVRGKGYPAHKNTVEGQRWYLNDLLRRGLTPVHADGIPDTV